MTPSLKPRSQRAEWPPIALGSVLALLGVVGGLAGALGWVGSWVTGVSVALVVVGGLVAFWNSVVGPVRTYREGRRESRDELRSVVEVEAAPLRAVDPYEVGVFPSELANETAETNRPPYVSRDADEHLDAALSEAVLDRNRRLVVVRGDPKSGKSRMLWEGLLRRVPDRVLVAVRPPLTTALDAPTSRPLATLLDVGLETPEDGLVVWVDDAHEHIGWGLDSNNLRRLVDAHQGIIVALTVHSGELERIKGFDEPLERRLRSASEGLVLDTKLSDDELTRARGAYPALADEDELVWLPEWFAAVDLLRNKYRDSRASEPIGVAVVKAAVDWQRAGMPRGIPEAALKRMTAVTLADIAPTRRLSEGAFRAGLAWATEEVAARAALLLPVAGAGEPVYAAFDAVGSRTAEEDAPLSDASWRFILDQLTVPTSIGVALAAHQAERPDLAETAWRKAVDSGDPELVPKALLGLGLTLRALERTGEAEAVWRQLLDRGDGDYSSEGALALGLLLGELGRSDEAEACYRRVVDSGDPAYAATATEALAGQLRKLNRFDEAELLYRQLVESGDPRYAPSAGFSLGLLYQQVGRSDEAAAAWREVIESGDPDLARQAQVSLILLGFTSELLRRAKDE